MGRVREDDLNLLLPTFRDRVKRLVEEMRKRGYKPIVRDTGRTPEEALKNAAKGSGIVDSMHCYGVAADLICEDHLWSCAMKDCRFFPLLGEVAESLGMVWGGRWQRRDLPHVQGIPVGWQDQMRALGYSPGSERARDDMVKLYFRRRSLP